MKKNSLNATYTIRLEFSLLIALIIIGIFFFSFPKFKQMFIINDLNVKPDFIITDTPQTIQMLKKLKPPKPEIPAKFDEVELMDDVEIAESDSMDSTFISDSTKLAFHYYDQLLPYLNLEKFDPGVLKNEEEPLAQYNEYLNKRLTEIFNNKKSYSSRSHIDDYLSQSMGRDPGMLSIDIGAVVDATKKYFKTNRRTLITIDNIVSSEKHWYILEMLWDKKGQSIFEIYNNESVRKNNTIKTLKESMLNLSENGLVFEVEDNERSRYYPTHSPQKMIEIVNRMLAQDVSNQHKEILSSFVNFIILNS